MRNFTPLIVAALVLFIGLAISNWSPAWMSEEKAKVTINHVSASSMSDGSMTVYCIMENKDTMATSDVEISLYVMDSVGTVLYTKELVFFKDGVLQPHQRAVFTEVFPDCWDCEGVRVVPH